MTLQEYLNPEDPVRMPRVELTPADYIVGIKLPFRFHPSRTKIYVNGIDAEYCLLHDDTVLWTTDQDGNPVSRSCFHISNHHQSTHHGKSEEGR